MDSSPDLELMRSSGAPSRCSTLCTSVADEDEAGVEKFVLHALCFYITKR